MKAMHKTAQSSAMPPNLSDSLKLDPSPSPQAKQWQRPQINAAVILSSKRYEKGNLTSQDRLPRFIALRLKTANISARCHLAACHVRFPAPEPGKSLLNNEQTA
jgi:hypothetical protein